MKNIIAILVVLTVISAIWLVWKQMNQSTKNENAIRQDKDELCACKTELAMKKGIFTVSKN